MIGAPLAGERMLLDDIMRARASSCASSDSGTCTAIWSPSKSALNAVHTSGCSWIALPSTSSGSNAWMPRDRKSTPLNSSHLGISYAVFCLKKKNEDEDLRELQDIQAKITRFTDLI